MSVTLNRRAYQHARTLINQGNSCSTNAMIGASISRPQRRRTNISASPGFRNTTKWFLGVNHEKPDDTKGHYEFPYGDFNKVHGCGVLAAESRAGQYKHYDIERAAAHLHGMMEGGKVASASKSKRPQTATAGTTARSSRRSAR